MKAIYIAGGKAGNTAVNIMVKHLEGLGHRVTRDAKDPLGWDVTLRWGMSYHGNKPALNAGVNKYDKYTAFQRFQINGVRCPFTFPAERALDMLDTVAYETLPWLGRKRQHVKGKDIVICNTRIEIIKLFETHSHDFFSVFIPTETEFRVWVINGEAIGVYEKVYKGEGEYEGFMRNRRFGFSFQKKDELRTLKTLVNPSIKAVEALGMDWGAVDVLEGKDGKYYVLEVNSMPHIDNMKRSSGIRLAAHVSKWAEQQ